MTRPLTIRKPTVRELQRLEALLETELAPQVQRRAEVLLAYAAGLNGVEIAEAVMAHPNTVYADLRAFDEAGLACLQPLPVGGAPMQITPEQLAEIWRLAERSPQEFGYVEARWTLAHFRDFLVNQRHLVPQLWLEHLRRLLKKKDIRFRGTRRKLLSHDPQRRAILARIRRVFQHLPPNGVLVFFDVKPVTVKAYGGRRFSGRPLTLERYQKTRGRFYLFALYDVNAERVRWRYYHGKSSEPVCRFMAQLRRWYPDQAVWVVLDQDPAHPRKSQETRGVMRALHLHWISLPKQSPDDNPCETIFSDIQLMIQDNSDDPDERTMRRRISGRLHQRNRKRQRGIAIPYLFRSHRG